MKCPFDDPNYKLPPDVPCPVCGMKENDKNVCVNNPKKNNLNN